MTKSELILKISESCQTMSKKQIEYIVNSLFSTIRSELKDNGSVEIRGFGSFRIRHKTARRGRNPKTGEKIDIPAVCLPYFRPGKEIKEQLLLNGGKIHGKSTSE